MTDDLAGVPPITPEERARAVRYAADEPDDFAEGMILGYEAALRRAEAERDAAGKELRWAYAMLHSAPKDLQEAGLPISNMVFVKESIRSLTEENPDA